VGFRRFGSVSQSIDIRAGTTAIKDQGRRGTCVACAATAVHEVVRADGVELSVEFLHWASKRRDGLPPLSEGTTLPAAKDALNQDGQPPEVRWPYDDTRDQWAATYQPPVAAMDDAERCRLNGGEMLSPTAAAIRDAIDRGRPVVVGIRLYATWYAVGPDGRIAMPAVGSRDLGGHAVLVLGYRGDELIVQNSWGYDWGADGSAYVPNDYVDRFALRHTFASFKAQSGVSPFQLEEWLGHARLDTTSIYVHMAKQNARKVMEATSLRHAHCLPTDGHRECCVSVNLNSIMLP
jgi:hypothetical protein